MATVCWAASERLCLVMKMMTCCGLPSSRACLRRAVSMTRCVPDATPSCSEGRQAQLTGFPLQVTIWEALTNSKPGTHPMSYEGRRQDRSVPTKPKRA